MNPAGALRIRIICDGRTVIAVHMASTRPCAAQWLSGQTTTSALARIPLLYSICRRAQECAGHAAVAAARGHPVGIEPAAAIGVWCEMTQEHLWRLLLDWPRELGLPPLEQEFSDWYRRLATTAKSPATNESRAQLGDFTAFVETTVLGMPCLAWRQLASAAEIKPGAGLAGRLWHALQDDAGSAAAIACLPVGNAAEFADVGAMQWDSTFERHPTWRGQPAEAGALARWQTQPLIAAQLAGRGVRPRLLARLMDLAQCAEQLAKHMAEYQAEHQADPGQSITAGLIDVCSPLPGVGIARVETARGTLVHYVKLEGDSVQALVKEYFVVAPTEWNFHPRGAFVAALQGARFADQAALRQQAQRLVLALDPCVAVQLEISHA